MRLAVVSGSAHPGLAAAIAQLLDVDPVPVEIEHFPDGEQRIEVSAGVRSADVFLIQPTGPPVDPNLVELALLGDACRRAGAARLTGVVPYFGYARQDRRKTAGQPLGARVAASIAGAAVDRLIVVDPHTPTLEAMSPVPLDALSAVPLLADALRARLPERAVLVAPDLGAVHLAERYAELLDLPVAVVRKERISGSEVRTAGVAGDVAGHVPLIVDDMISTGGTIEAAASAVRSAGAIGRPIVAASHGLFVGPAAERLRALDPEAILVAGTLPQAAANRLPIEVVPIASLLAGAIRESHLGE